MLFPERTRFIVACFDGRVGSTMLVSMLGQHPEIRCFGEILNPSHPFLVDGEQVPLSGTYSFWKAKFATQSKVVGFKLLADQIKHLTNPIDIYNILSSCQVVYLDRRNPFDAVLSRTLVHRENLFQGRPYSRQPVALNPVMIKSYMDWQRYESLVFRKVLQINSISVLDVLYEDIWSRFADILRFLRVATLPTPTPSTIKQRVGTKRNWIANYDELKAFFANTVYAPFFDET